MRSTITQPLPKGSLSLCAPKQVRSQQTLDRLLSATRDLLYEKDFSEITVAEIVYRSNSSLGAFYARFGSKEALLPALYEAYSRGLSDEETVWSEPATWGVRSLATRVAKFVRFVIRDYRASRAFMRPLALYVRENASSVSSESLHASRRKHRDSCAFLLECRAEITHPDPERAVDLLAYFVPAIGRDKILFGDAPHASSIKVEDLELEEELIRMAMAYLTGASAIQPMEVALV